MQKVHHSDILAQTAYSELTLLPHTPFHLHRYELIELGGIL